MSCMQECFASKTGREQQKEEITNPEQITKIKSSAYCGNTCSEPNTNSKKARDFCFAGCLDNVLKPNKLGR